MPLRIEGKSHSLLLSCLRLRRFFKATAAADASKYGADKTVEVAEVNAQGTIDNTRATGDETRKTQDNETRLKAKDRANMHSYARSTARAF